MILYNVTIKVNHDIADKWLTWLKDEHIPEMIQTGCFTKTKILQILEPVEEEGITYAVQYFAADITDYDRYITEYSERMRQKGLNKWGDQFIAFRTLMKVVH